MILGFKTDQPIAELYLIDHSSKEIAREHWLADRELAGSLLPHLRSFLKKNKTTFNDLDGIIVFTGEGSFTGLRIGTTVANSLAYGLQIPVVKAKSQKWLRLGLSKLKKAKVNDFVTPDYSGPPNITTPKQH